MTDFRALCAELAENVRYLLDCVADGDSDPVAIAECVQHLGFTRVALAQPEGEGSSDQRRLAAPAVEPIPVSERPWERDGWCDAEGRCWYCNAYSMGKWTYETALDSEQDWGILGTQTHSLPHWAIARPRPKAKEPTQDPAKTSPPPTLRHQ